MLLAIFIVRKSSDEGPGKGARIAGTVVLRASEPEGAELDARAGHEARALPAFVPTATAVGATDACGDPLIFRGAVEERGDGTFGFEIPVSLCDTFRLGFEGSSELDDGRRLVWDATAEPSEVAVEPRNGEVDGVVYTVTGVSSHATAS